MSWRIFICSFAMFLIPLSAEVSIADTNSIGPNGINAGGLAPGGVLLTGSDVNIGQVEQTRPGKPDFDILHNDLVDPDFVYYRDFLPPNDLMRQNVADGLHALQVAGVMIAAHSTEEGEDAVHGVAPGAVLHASAFDPTGPGYIGTLGTTIMLTTQRIATVSNMRAINMSFNLGLSTQGEPNGLQPITAFVDWSARLHNVLYVVAGTALDQNNMFDGAIVPSDNYNGITVAASMRPQGEQKFRQVWNRNYYGADAVGQRTSIDILAPGENILTTSFPNDNSIPESGTSIAAPHATGTVALLQQFATSKFRLRDGTQRARAGMK
jgi:subtilisin family serine protease